MNSQTQQYSYDRGPVYADLVRSAAGCAVTFGPVLFLNPIPAVFWICLAGGALFTVFGIKTLVKAATTVSLDDREVRLTGPLSASVAWDDLRSVKLRYYATRRKSTQGWMQMILRGAGRKVVIDSALDGFETIARTAAAHVLKNDLEVDFPTQENFNALGIRLDTQQE